ncbi:MAG: TonB-dependent receptor domain-containing protein [Terriglobia bacterium]
MRSNEKGKMHGVLILASAMLVLLLPSWGKGQNYSASVQGIVTDSSGLPVPSVEVAVTDVTTNVVTRTETNRAGAYAAPFLKPSTYKVTFKKKGFKQYVTNTIPLSMNQKYRLDVALAVGAVTQTVTVNAGATQLNTVSSQIGAEVGHSDLVNLPEQIGQNGPRELVMARIFPGVGSTSSDYSNPNNLTLGGGRPVTTPIITDGLPSNMTIDNTYGFVPSPDSTQELQVLTSPFSAEYGQTSGGVLLTTTKSGTDQLHGSLFEYHSDQTLDALSFFSTSSTSQPKNIFNYFGGSLGGPVYIPKVYNGLKRHTYFFTDWEDTLQDQGHVFNSDVPTAAERTGDFSGPTPQGTPAIPIYDPSTTQVVGGNVVRQPLLGNMIPAGRIDLVGAKIIAAYPASNCNLSPFNYCVAPASRHTYLYNTEKIDQVFSGADRAWFRFARDGPTDPGALYIPGPGTTANKNGWRDYQGEASWNHIFSPSVVNEFRFGYVEEDNFTQPYPSNASSLGLKGVPLTQFPTISASDLASLGTCGYYQESDRHWIFNDAVDVQKGRHSLNMGGEVIRYVLQDYCPGVLPGSYCFCPNFTSLPGVNQTGMSLADLELGYPTAATIQTNDYEFRQRLNYEALYFQDDFKATSKLTLNLGLRWEFDGPYTEVNNQVYNFNPSLTDPATGQKGAIQFAGVNGAPRHFTPNDYHGFLPRVGFAWSFAPNTVLRGGYGIYELPSIGFATFNQVSKYSVSAEFVSPDGITPPFELDQGVPPYSYDVDANGNFNIPLSLTNPSSAVGQFETRSVLPYSQQWQLGLQHQFPHGWFGEVDYDGNKGTKLPIVLPTDQIIPTPNCCFGVPNAQLLRPYPQVLGVEFLSYSGNSNYNSLLVKVQHHWSNGLSALFSYTWAKTMDDVDCPARCRAASVQNVFDIASEYGVAGYDIPQRFVATWVYQLPFGAGGRFASSTPVVSRVIGHWQVSGVGQFQNGNPYTIGQNNTLGLFSGAQYPNRVGNPQLSNPTLAEWFNTSAFQVAPPDTLGNAARNLFFGPGQNNFDISVMRNFPVKERYTLQIRGDFYNAFNHPQFNSLNTNLNSAAFGRVTGVNSPRNIQLVARLSF